MRFLLVEDNVAAAEAVAWAIDASGHEVKTVHTGREVLGMINHHQPDIIILDVSLPDVNGVVVSKWIRRDYPALPIIVATGHGAFAGMDEVLAQRRVQILHKPYAMKELLGMAKELMKGSFDLQ